MNWPAFCGARFKAGKRKRNVIFRNFEEMLKKGKQSLLSMNFFTFGGQQPLMHLFRCTMFQRVDQNLIGYNSPAKIVNFPSCRKKTLSDGVSSFYGNEFFLALNICLQSNLVSELFFTTKIFLKRNNKIKIRRGMPQKSSYFLYFLLMILQSSNSIAMKFSLRYAEKAAFWMYYTQHIVVFLFCFLLTRPESNSIELFNA